jgi:hypothetical protein
MTPVYRVGDAVSVIGACGHDLTVEHVVVAASKESRAGEGGRYYALLCFTPGCERRYSWRGEDDTPRPLDH